MRPDPTIRNSFWTVNIGAIVMTYSNFGMTQAIFQRCISLGSVRKAKWAIALAVLAEWIIFILMAISGVVMFVYFYDCDPYTQGKVFSPDQIMPYMVMDVFAKMPGVPGIFLSSVVSASLSTLSSGLNALAAVAGEDIVKKIWPNLDGRTYTAITKALSFFFGLVAIGVAFLAMEMGDQVLSMGWSIGGITIGAVVATFTLGVCCPRINHKGILLGTIVSTSILTWLKVGQMFSTNIRSDKLPLSVEGCLTEQNNSTNFTDPMITTMETRTSSTESSLNETVNDQRNGLENFYSLSYHLYGAFGFLITVPVAFLASAITGFNDPDTIDKRLLVDLNDAFCCCLPSRWQRKYHFAKNDVTDDECPATKSFELINGATYSKIPGDPAPHHEESEHSIPRPYSRETIKEESDIF